MYKIVFPVLLLLGLGLAQSASADISTSGLESLSAPCAFLDLSCYLGLDDISTSGLTDDIHSGG